MHIIAFHFEHFAHSYVQSSSFFVWHILGWINEIFILVSMDYRNSHNIIRQSENLCTNWWLVSGSMHPVQFYMYEVLEVINFHKISVFSVIANILSDNWVEWQFMWHHLHISTGNRVACWILSCKVHEWVKLIIVSISRHPP